MWRLQLLCLLLLSGNNYKINSDKVSDFLYVATTRWRNEISAKFLSPRHVMHVRFVSAKFRQIRTKLNESLLVMRLTDITLQKYIFFYLIQFKESWVLYVPAAK